MGRLTYSEGGRFGVVGMNEANEKEKLYGCICKLKDYENTGLSPDEVERLLDEEPRKPTRRAQSIVQIIPAYETVSTFGRRDIDADGTIKKQITERLPVICWALVADDEFYVMGMVAQEAGEIILVNQREDFLEYETAASGTLERICDTIDEYGIPKSVMVDTGDDEYWASQEMSEICSPVGKVRDRRILQARSNLRNRNECLLKSSLTSADIAKAMKRIRFR